MKNIFKTGLLVLSLAAAFSFTQADTAFANIPKPKRNYSVALSSSHNEKIGMWREAVETDDMDWEAHAHLALLYYDQRNFVLVQKHAQKAQKLFETYEIYGDDNLVREYMVKGAASAYHRGNRVLAENMLKRMLDYKLGGSTQHKNTYNGMAYYYLADIERGNGNYSKARSYINKAISYCPDNKRYSEYKDNFYHQNGKWNWRSNSNHKVSQDMPKYDRNYDSKRTTRKTQPPLRKPGSSYSSSQTTVKHTTEHKDSSGHDWKSQNHQPDKQSTSHKVVNHKASQSTSTTSKAHQPIKQHQDKTTSVKEQHKVQHPIVKQEHKVVQPAKSQQKTSDKENHKNQKSNSEQQKPAVRYQHRTVNTVNSAK